MSTTNGYKLDEVGASEQVRRANDFMRQKLGVEAEPEPRFGTGSSGYHEEVPDSHGTDITLLTRAKERRFKFKKPPPESVPRFMINGRGVSTPGNLTNLIAQAKAGKTAVVAALLAASIVADCGACNRDTLGVTATAPGKLHLIHLDTEQSPWDHDQLVRRALRRAGVAEPPAWLWSYGLAGFSADELKRILRLLVAEAAATGGVFAVIIDGTADLVVDVNDAAECNAFVAELHALAIRYDCPIVNVVHENPGQDFGKMRGHLGSQLERKAESNLRLKKSEEVTVVYSEKMRRAPILEKDGPRFQWDDEHGMHMSVATSAVTKEEQQRERQRDSAEAVFRHVGKATIGFAELVRAISDVHQVGASAAEDRFSKMKKLGVIEKTPEATWRLARSNPVTP